MRPRLQYLQDTANSQDRRVNDHTEHQHQHHLDLLYVIGTPSNQGRGGKLTHLFIGKRNHLMEYPASQVSAGTRRHARRPEGHRNRKKHAQKRQSQHLKAYAAQIAHLCSFHIHAHLCVFCLLYTSDAADEL